MITPETLAALVNLGAAGAVIIVVIYMTNKSEKRDASFLASLKEQAQMWQDFFTKLNQANKDDLVALVTEFKAHATETREAIATMKERTRPVQRQPRKGPE